MMKKIELYKFIKKGLFRRSIRKEEKNLGYELNYMNSIYSGEQWRTEYTRERKKSILEAGLRHAERQGGEEGEEVLQYGERLLIINDKIDILLDQLDINEQNYKTADFDLVRLAGLLMMERDLIDERSAALHHKHLLPSIFDAIIPVVHQKRPELDLKEFHKIYKEMWDYFPHKPIGYKKQELFNKLQAAVKQQNFSKEWLGKEKKEMDIGDTELHFFVDKLFREFTGAW